MRRFAEKHLRPVPAVDQPDGILPSELAERIVRERDRFDWFSDRPGSVDPQGLRFGDPDVAAARSARKAVGRDLDYLAATLPSIANRKRPPSPPSIRIWRTPPASSAGAARMRR
jgi:hypothetical protein